MFNFFYTVPAHPGITFTAYINKATSLEDAKRRVKTQLDGLTKCNESKKGYCLTHYNEGLYPTRTAKIAL